MMNQVRAVKNIWDRVIVKNKDYKNIAKTHIDLVERLEKIQPLITELPLNNIEAKEKLSKGIPYLEGEEENVQLAFAIQHFRELTNWSGLGEARSLFKKVGKKSSDADLERLLKCWLTGDSSGIDAFIAQYDLPMDILYVVIRYSLLPTLHQYAKQLNERKIFNEEKWMKDYCPVCGDQHGLAEYRGSERFRHFRCLSCAGDWIFWRIACPLCENKDHEKLSALLIQEENNSFQIDICEECNGYVKGINKLDASSPMFLLLDDFLTFHLDLLAKEKGFHRQPSSPMLQ